MEIAITRKRLYVSIALLLSLAVLISGILLLARRPQTPPQQNRQAQYHDPTTGLEIKYPEQNTKKEILTEADKKDKIILRLTVREGGSPMLVTVRSESGLRAVANLTKTAIIDTLMRNSDKAFPQRFKGFKKERSRRFEHKGRNAGEVIFTYDSPIPGKHIKQRFVIFVKDDDTAVYLAMQSQEEDFKKQNTKVFEPIASSLDFQ